MRVLSFVAAGLAATLAVAPAASAQALLVTKKSISSTAARALVEACMDFAAKHNQIVAAAVVDSEGTLLDFHAMQGATVTNIESAPLKARTSVRWRRSTQSIGDRVKSGENEAPVWLHDFPQRGALPIVIEGELVGAMGIGGAGSDECAAAAIKAVFGGAATTDMK